METISLNVIVLSKRNATPLTNCTDKESNLARSVQTSLNIYRAAPLFRWTRYMHCATQSPLDMYYLAALLTITARKQFTRIISI